MRRPTVKQKPRDAQVISFPAPTGGLIANRNLSMSRGPDLPPGAAVLTNFFPTASGVLLRRGSARWASVVEDTPIVSLFIYVTGAQQELFAATATDIFNITDVPSPYNYVLVNEDDDYIAVDEGDEEVLGEDSLSDLVELDDQDSGDWVVVQFSTAGGNFLVGVNGADPAFLYNGTAFGATTISFPDGSDLTTADLSYVWAYKERLYFIEKNSLNVWYLPVDQIGGELTLLPLGGVFSFGGTLMWGHVWSLSAGGDGGLSEQCVFVTTQGEVAAFQGLSPDSAETWDKVGVYRIGRPMGHKAFIRAGGDLVIATTVGFVSLGAASSNDYAALGRFAISHSIEDEWARAVAERGEVDWRCEVWPDRQMVLVAPPTPPGRMPMVFVANSNTGAWGLYTGWDITALETFQGRLFFGSRDGAVREGNVGGSDEGLPYVGSCLPLFDSIAAAASRKIAKHARFVKRSAQPCTVQVTARFDFNTTLPAPPDQTAVSLDNTWDNGVWGVATWDSDRNAIVTSNWRSVGGSGQDLSVAGQITSGSTVPLDAELLRLDLTYTTADIVT